MIIQDLFSPAVMDQVLLCLTSLESKTERIKVNETFFVRKTTNDTVQVEMRREYEFENDLRVYISKPHFRETYKTVAVYVNRQIFLPLEIHNLYQHTDVDTTLPKGFEIRTFTLIENAVIGAFSAETYVRAFLRKDFKYQVNDLKVEIIMSFNNEPNVWLDDVYNINHPVAIYFPNGQMSYHSEIRTKSQFDKLLSLEILEMCKNAGTTVEASKV